ncbi:hypothetical protein RA988_24825, partial [Mycobacteroides abscessus subsp. massiliense]
QSMDSFDQAPAATAIEQQVVEYHTSRSGNNDNSIARPDTEKPRRSGAVCESKFALRFGIPEGTKLLTRACAPAGRAGFESHVVTVDGFDRLAEA